MAGAIDLTGIYRGQQDGTIDQERFKYLQNLDGGRMHGMGDFRSRYFGVYGF